MDSTLSLYYENASEENVLPATEQTELQQAIDFLHADSSELLLAAERGDDRRIQNLIRKGVNVNQIDTMGRTALHIALGVGVERSVTLLLDAGANTNVKDTLGMTPLSVCLMRRPSLKIATLLFEHGAKLLPRTCPMDSGLFIQFIMMCTLTREEIDSIKLLVSKGALVNDPDAPGGRQALHFAAMSNNCRLIKLLYHLGANLYLTNHRNETPKQVALSFKCKEAAEYLENLEKRAWSNAIVLNI